MPKGFTLNSAGGALSAYNPTLRDKIAWALSDAFGGGDRTKVNAINKQVRGAADFAPILGDLIGAEDTGRAVGEGRYGDAALSGVGTALGTIPGLGDLAAAGLKGAGSALGMSISSVPKWIEAYHGTRSPETFDKLRAGVKDIGLHVTQDPKIADRYAGISDDGLTGPEQGIGGRVFPILVDPGRMFDGRGILGDPIDWNDPKSVVDALVSPTEFSKEGMPPIIKELFDDVVAGKRIDEAFKSRGYDSVQYDHYPDPYSEPGHAMMVFDENRIINKLSEEGLAVPPNRIKKARRKRTPNELEDLGYFAEWFGEN